MSYGAQLMIAWTMFKDWLKEVFGQSVAVGFPTQPQEVFVR